MHVFYSLDSELDEKREGGREQESETITSLFSCRV